jgi:hypothetical protein
MCEKQHLTIGLTLPTNLILILEQTSTKTSAEGRMGGSPATPCRSVSSHSQRLILIPRRGRIQTLFRSYSQTCKVNKTLRFIKAPRFTKRGRELRWTQKSTVPNDNCQTQQPWPYYMPRPALTNKHKQHEKPKHLVHHRSNKVGPLIPRYSRNLQNTKLLRKNNPQTSAFNS